jgi:hypothetical protein
VRLFGAAEALRAATGWRLPPAYASGYERYLAAARAELDEATFAAAWIEGSGLTLEQAVAEALAFDAGSPATESRSTRA